MNSKQKKFLEQYNKEFAFSQREQDEDLFYHAKKDPAGDYVVMYQGLGEEDDLEELFDPEDEETIPKVSYSKWRATLAEAWVLSHQEYKTQLQVFCVFLEGQEQIEKLKAENEALKAQLERKGNKNA